MLKTWMGEDKFFEGVSTYLKKNSYSNARTDDLWAALGKVGKSYKMLIPKGDFTFRLVASGYRDDQDKTS